jgi:putative tricarboxylic transport membrane protein
MDAPDQKLVSIRAMDAAVAVGLLIVSGVVMMDSLRLGVQWNEMDGPAAGYFPFYIGVILALASVVNLVQAVSVDRAAGARIFVTKTAFRRVLAVLLPLALYVVALSFIGIYAASAIYIALFMRYVGKHSLLHGAAVGLGVAITLFMMFEVWFLVPLPKGPIENMLGY